MQCVFYWKKGDPNHSGLWTDHKQTVGSKPVRQSQCTGTGYPAWQPSPLHLSSLHGNIFSRVWRLLLAGGDALSTNNYWMDRLISCWRAVLRSAVGKTHDLRSDLWWTILYSEIDHTYLSIEAQCVSHHYPRWTATGRIRNVTSVVEVRTVESPDTFNDFFLRV